MSEEKKKPRSREDKDFVKMYRKFIKAIADLSMKNPTALTILLFLIRNMDGLNAIGVSTTAIGSLTGYSRQTVSKSIKYLKENGWIEIFKQGTSNIYVINPDVVWTSYAEQKAYCNMKSSLLLSSDDNWEICVNPKAKDHYKFINEQFIDDMLRKERSKSDEYNRYVEEYSENE